MFAICLGRIEFRKLAEISGSRGAVESPQCVGNPIRHMVRDGWNGCRVHLPELVLREIRDFATHRAAKSNRSRRVWGERIEKT